MKVKPDTSVTAIGESEIGKRTEALGMVPAMLLDFKIPNNLYKKSTRQDSCAFIFLYENWSVLKL